MRKLLLFGLLFGTTGCALSTTQLHVTAATAITADCVSTIILIPRADFEETNPILGPEPMPSDIVAGCLAAQGAVHGLAVLLPERWRRGWLTWITVMELTYFVHNMSLAYGH